MLLWIVTHKASCLEHGLVLVLSTVGHAYVTWTTSHTLSIDYRKAEDEKAPGPKRYLKPSQDLNDVWEFEVTQRPPVNDDVEHVLIQFPLDVLDGYAVAVLDRDIHLGDGDPEISLRLLILEDRGLWESLLEQ